MEDSADGLLLKLVLKQDWDIPVNLPLPNEPVRGHFAGRKSELDALTNEFIRRTNGAILVSGHRGAGKTSLVHQALNDARRENPCLLPILVSAGHLKELNDESKPAPKALIEAIVRRLYSTAHAAAAEATTVAPTHNNSAAASDTTAKKTNASDRTPEAQTFPADLLDAIDTLYRKCVAAEFKLIESVSVKAEHSDEDIREQILEHNVNVGPLLAHLPKIAWAVAGMTAVAPFIPSAPARSLAAMGIAGFPYAASAVLRRKRTTADTSNARLSAKELYEFDSKIGNLEFDLEVIHRKARERGWKLVYVIDELDKVEVKDVKAVIEVCKNLFTLSDAIFVFLADEGLYDLGGVKEGTIYGRGREYTYFNSRYYIGAPTSADLEAFLDEIILHKQIADDDLILERLRHCLFFEARNDFFDLISAIRGRISGFEGHSPVIEICPSGMEDDDIQKARLGMCISSLYEDKYRSTSALKWRQNSNLLTILYSHALLFLKQPPPAEIPDPAGHRIEDALVRDFNRLLYKLGSLNEQRQKPQSQHGNGPPPLFYPYAGPISSDPSPRLNIHTEFERGYLSEMERYFGLVSAVANLWHSASSQPNITASDFAKDDHSTSKLLEAWGYDPRNVLNQHLEIYRGLTEKPPPYPERQAKMNEYFKQVTSGINSLCNNLPTVLGKMLISLMPQAHGELFFGIYQGAGDAMNGDAAPLRKAFGSRHPAVLNNTDFTKQIVILIDAAEQLSLMGKDMASIVKVCKVVCISRKAKEHVPKEVFRIDCWDDERLLETGQKTIEKLLKYLAAK